MSHRIFKPANGPAWLPEYTRSIEQHLHHIDENSIAAVTATAILPSEGTILVDATAGAVTLNVPPAADITGRIFTVKKIDASVNAVTIEPNGAETIDGAANLALSAQWDAAMVQSNGTALFILGSV